MTGVCPTKETMEDDGIDRILANTLGISSEAVNDDLSFSEIPEWDSLNHVNLMLALERALHTEIDEDLMVSLTSVRAIRAFAAARKPDVA
jgi:citrate synthase